VQNTLRKALILNCQLMSDLSGCVRTSLTDSLRVALTYGREAEERIVYLREFGPTPHAFTLREHFPPPDAVSSGPLHSPEEWTCPA
jgi:hypothetical protein